MIDKFDRLELRIGKYQKFRELLDDCFNIYEIADKAGLTYRKVHHILRGTRKHNYVSGSKRQFILSQGRKYLTIRKAVHFYCAKRTAKVLHMREETVYDFYKAYRSNLK